jgi:hypothetical protein
MRKKFLVAGALGIALALSSVVPASAATTGHVVFTSNSSCQNATAPKGTVWISGCYYVRAPLSASIYWRDYRVLSKQVGPGFPK